MGKINEFIDYIKNLQREQVIEMLIAIVVVILFFVMGSFIAYGILRIFYKKDNR